MSSIVSGASEASVDEVWISREGVESLVVVLLFVGDDDSDVVEDDIDVVVVVGGEWNVVSLVVTGVRGDLETVGFFEKKSDIFRFFDAIITITIYLSEATDYTHFLWETTLQETQGSERQKTLQSWRSKKLPKCQNS